MLLYIQKKEVNYPWVLLICIHTLMHQTASFTPAHLVHLAKEAGLCAIALTDHDTTAGIADAVDAGKELGVEVIPGIEVSDNYEAMKSIF